MKSVTLADFFSVQFIAWRFDRLANVTRCPLPRRLIIIGTVYAETERDLEVIRETQLDYWQGALRNAFYAMYEHRKGTGDLSGRWRDPISNEERKLALHRELTYNIGQLFGSINALLVHTATNGGATFVQEQWKALLPHVREQSATGLTSCLEDVLPKGEYPEEWADDDDFASEHVVLADSYAQYLNNWERRALRMVEACEY